MNKMKIKISITSHVLIQFGRGMINSKEKNTQWIFSFFKWKFSIGIFLFTWKIESVSRINQKKMRTVSSLKLQKEEHGLLNPSEGSIIRNWFFFQLQLNSTIFLLCNTNSLLCIWRQVPVNMANTCKYYHIRLLECLFHLLT